MDKSNFCNFEFLDKFDFKPPECYGSKSWTEICLCDITCPSVYIKTRIVHMLIYNALYLWHLKKYTMHDFTISYQQVQHYFKQFQHTLLLKGKQNNFHMFRHLSCSFEVSPLRNLWSYRFLSECQVFQTTDKSKEGSSNRWWARKGSKRLQSPKLIKQP